MSDRIKHWTSPLFTTLQYHDRIFPIPESALTNLTIPTKMTLISSRSAQWGACFPSEPRFQTIYNISLGLLVGHHDPGVLPESFKPPVQQKLDVPVVTLV